jgi:primary-amine oxidase
MENLRFSERLPHPLEQLTISECNQARDFVRRTHPDTVIDFRTISLEEPPKAQLQKFLDIEHSGKLQSNTPRPDRLARVSYDVIGSDKIPTFHESVIDLRNGFRIGHEVIDSKHHAPLTMYAHFLPPCSHLSSVSKDWDVT